MISTYSTNGVSYPTILISSAVSGEITYYDYVFYADKSIINNANISEGDNITIIGQMEYDDYRKHSWSSKDYFYAFYYNVKEITAINKE